MQVIPYRRLDGYRYQTRRNYAVAIPIKGIAFRRPFFSLSTDGKLSICSGYAWDGASGGVRDTRKNLGASLVHDVLYQSMREGLLPTAVRREVDDLFGAHCVALGTSRARARLYVWALRVFGARFARRQPPRHPVEEMPAP